MTDPGGRRLLCAALLAAGLGASACASVYRQGVSAGKRGEWDAAVAKLIRRLPAGEDWHSFRRVV